jgi:hypothetical protein
MALRNSSMVQRVRLDGGLVPIGHIPQRSRIRSASLVKPFRHRTGPRRNSSPRIELKQAGPWRHRDGQSASISCAGSTAASQYRRQRINAFGQAVTESG